MGNEALIKPKIIEWARERLNLPLRSIARKISTKEEVLKSWEDGESNPTFRQAQKLAKVLHIPFGYLFLSSPPDEKVGLPDLRTVSGARRGEFSPDFHEVINDAFRKQQWYREYLLEESADKLPFIGKFKGKRNYKEIAQDISNHIKLNNTFRNQVRNWEEFLFEFIQRAESQRILVLRSGIVKNDTHRKLSVEEFRGFAICDDIAPLIFLNGRDSKAAQIFTLAHELAHLWIGESGVSNPDLGKRSIVSNQDIESLCNNVAAELLVPEDEFNRSWKRKDLVEQNVARLIRQYRVSSLVILRRAFDLKTIGWDDYKHHYDLEMSRFRDRNDSQKSSGGDPYATLGVRNSKRFTKTVLSATLSGQLLFRDASRLLGLKVDKIEKAAKKLGIR